MGCFWGAERIFWRLPGVFATAVGLRRRLHPQPHLRGDLYRAHRPHRGRPRGLRPRADLLPPPARGVLHRARPHPGRRPGQRPRHPVPLGGLRDHRRAAARGRLPRFEAFGKALADAGKRPIATELAPAGDVLLRRGVPPAVPAQGPQRLLRPPGHRRGLPAPRPARRPRRRPRRRGRAKVADAARPRRRGRRGRRPQAQAAAPSPTTSGSSASPPPSTRCCARRAPSGRSPAPTPTSRSRGCTAAWRAATRSTPATPSSTPAAGGPASPRRCRPTAIELIEDRSHGMVRTEVRCGRCHTPPGPRLPRRAPGPGRPALLHEQPAPSTSTRARRRLTPSGGTGVRTADPAPGPDHARPVRSDRVGVSRGRGGLPSRSGSGCGCSVGPRPAPEPSGNRSNVNCVGQVVGAGTTQ